MEITFKTVASLQLENSFTVLNQENDVNLECTIGINELKGTGYFELYDEETGGDNWYAEGGLWFNDKDLVEYDGVFNLPDFIIDKIVELGYNNKL